MNPRSLFALTILAAIALPTLFGGCTSEPLLSRRGGVAVGELGVQALVVLGRGMGGNPVNDNLDASDMNYLGGVVPIPRTHRERARPVEKGSRLFVDGRARGSIPVIANLPKPGPHTVRLEIPGWQPHTLTVAHPFRMRVGEGEIESWPPVFVNCKTGKIFTAEKLPFFDPSRYSGTAFKVGPDPMLIVTTADKRRSGGKMIGEMKSSSVAR